MSKRRSIPKTDDLLSESQELIDAINGESSLACALIVGASLERVTIALAGNFLLDGETAKDLFRENGALGTFAACAKMAYCLGLISKGMYENLNTFGQIRNIFAHSNIHIDFDEPGIAELCDKLTFPQISQHVVAGGGEPTPLHELYKTPREWFSITGILAFNTLLAKASSVERRSRHTDGWSN
jgi:hypothetical protein